MTAFSLCSGGAAGIDFACEAAGIRTLAYCDSNPQAAALLHKNWPGRPIFKDIAEVDRILQKDREALKAYGIYPGSITLITCGWPCQSYAVPGRRRGRDDKRGRIFDHALSIANQLEAPFILGENVRGAATIRYIPMN